MTSGKMIFKIGKTDYPFITHADGYRNGVWSFISSLKILCAAELISFDEVYKFIKQYASCYGIYWLGLGMNNLIAELPHIKITDLMLPFSDGYLDREDDDSYDDYEYTYEIGYKLTTLSYNGTRLDLIKIDQEESRKRLIKYVFTEDIDLT